MNISGCGNIEKPDIENVLLLDMIQMKTNQKYKNLVVYCFVNLEDYFVKGKLYNCVFIEDEYRVYGEEFILHCKQDYFNKYFKVKRRGKCGQ